MCLAQHISTWKDITLDQELLQTVQGMKLEYEEGKSKFVPAKRVKYLGFISDLEKVVTIYQIKKKKKKDEEYCAIPTKPKLTIKKLLILLVLLRFRFQ